MYTTTPGSILTTVNSTFTEKDGFLTRFTQGVVGIFVGIALVLASCAFIFWNEYRIVKLAQSMEEGMNSVKPIGDGQAVIPENNGHLIHITATPTVPQYLFDEEYNVKVNAVKLKRLVEMFQWHEQVHTNEVEEGDTTRTDTSYSYTTDWDSNIIDSSTFHESATHENPKTISIPSKDLVHPNALIGRFTFSAGLLEKMSSYHPADVKMMENATGYAPFHIRENSVYHCEDPSAANVGDLRVVFTYAGPARVIGDKESLTPASPISILAQQTTETTLSPYQTYGGTDIEQLEEGEMSAKEMFEKTLDSNSQMNWIFRFICLVAMYAGFTSTTKILNVLVSWIPYLGKIISFGLVLANGLMAVSLTVTMTALAWIVFRPLLGLAAILLVIVTIGSVSYFGEVQKVKKKV